MPGFRESAVCHAPPEEVFKLLYDPSRFPEWWAGMDRVETGPGGGVTRFMSEWPDFPYPTQVAVHREDGRVLLSCLLSDIRHDWRIAPHPAGCLVSVEVEVPEPEAHRIPAQRAEVVPSLRRLVARAEEVSRAG
ncbi:MAG: SRPBCC family protein [Actinomycetota bacterium]